MPASGYSRLIYKFTIPGKRSLFTTKPALARPCLYAANRKAPDHQAERIRLVYQSLPVSIFSVEN